MIHKTTNIHPSAIVEDGAKIGANVTIGPFTYITSTVEIGDDTEIMSHIVIKGHTKIGKANRIFPHAVIGEENQDKKYKGEATTVVIGDRNVIREAVQIHKGTVQDKATTIVGNDNLLCVNAHIAHDVIIGSHTHIGNNAILGGHVVVDDYAGVMALSAIHPNCKVGAYAYIGGCSAVVQDVPAYVLAQGNHAAPYGLNLVGLKRHGFSRDEIRIMQKAYKEIYRNGNTLEQAKEILITMSEQYQVVGNMLKILSTSERGIIR